MLDPQHPFPELLTPEEAAQVDAALMSSQDKFLTRLAIYALRSLRQISQKTGQPLTEITPQIVADWVTQDASLQQQIEPDPSFTLFFTNLVLSSLKPLEQAAQANGTTLEKLEATDAIAWFEAQAKRNLTPNI
jgi:hypothetical protein